MINYHKQNKAMVQECTAMGIKDPRILEAMLKIHRHLFIPEEWLSEAYGNYPIPIPGDQTISQPYTVAFMIEAMELKETDRVLEVGAGSGWNAALIASIAAKGRVITTEIISDLIKFSRDNIAKLKPAPKNIKIIEYDGSQGYEKEAPYDKIICTAACPSIPKPWIEQLKEGGIIIAPIGHFYGQNMIKARKIKGKFQEEVLGGFMFVLLRGKYGFK